MAWISKVKRAMCAHTTMASTPVRLIATTAEHVTPLGRGGSARSGEKTMSTKCPLCVRNNMENSLYRKISAYLEECRTDGSAALIGDRQLCGVALGFGTGGAIGLIPQTVARAVLSEFFDKR